MSMDVKALGNKLKKNITPFSVVVGAILILYTAAILILFFWAIIMSFKNWREFRADAISFPSFFDLSNYQTMFDEFLIRVPIELADGTKTRIAYKMLDQFVNSLLYSAGGALCQTVCTVMVAYCTSKYKGIFSSIIHTVVIVTIALPIVGNMPSMINVLQTLGLYDNLIGMWIMKFGFANIYYFIFYAAFEAISWDFAEAAFIDGSSHYGVFFKIMLPMVMPLFGTIFLMFFIQYWNDYQSPMIYWASHPTVAYGLYDFMHSTAAAVSSNTPAKIAGGVIVFIPMFIVFLIFKNKLMSNLTEGGIKA